LALTRDDVHVWRIPLGLPRDVLADLVPLLSREENARAARILDEDARRWFVAAHGATRSILSRYAGERAEEIQFATGGRGKPYLVTSSGAPAICFSLSHSEQIALCAVADGRDIGVDVERVRPVSAWREIAARYFSTGENQALCSLTDEQASEAFFWGWTRKEAYTKALGEGVSERWTQFTLSLQPGAAAERVSDAAGTQAKGAFTLCPLVPGSGYVGAVAARGEGWRLNCWQWSWAELPQQEIPHSSDSLAHVWSRPTRSRRSVPGVDPQDLGDS
jgi:4'-phosphopantetheinyl transferase